MDKTDVDRILREIHVVQACVHGIATRLDDGGFREEESFQNSIRELANYHLIREWLRDAGMSSYEISVAQENTVAGAVVVNAIIEGIKTGLMLTVRVVREESEVAVQAVQGWIAAGELVKDSPSAKRWEETPVLKRMQATFSEHSKLLLARADAIDADDDVDAEEAAVQAAFLRGRAAEANDLTGLILTTFKNAEDDPPKK